MRLPFANQTSLMKRRAIGPGLALSALAAVSAWHFELDHKAGELNASVAGLRQKLQAASATGGADLQAVDFTQRLPAAMVVEPVVRELQRSSAALGVAFVSVSSAGRAPSLQTLGRGELAITLRGAYPKLKTVLAETLDRFPELIVQRLTLRRMATPADLEAHVDLVLVTRPLPAAGAGG